MRPPSVHRHTMSDGVSAPRSPNEDLRRRLRPVVVSSGQDLGRPALNDGEAEARPPGLPRDVVPVQTMALDSNPTRSRGQIGWNYALKSAGGNDPAPLRIYVVDDHVEMCASLTALLTSCGFLVTCFTDPMEFLSGRSSLTPGLVLLDLRMPGKTGLEVLEAIANDLSNFPTVVITAHGEIDAAVRAIKLGARDFIQKPFRDSALLEVIEKVTYDFRKELRPKSCKLANVLTPREYDVAQALTNGKTNKAIAQELGISVRTVDMHRARVMQKLDCRSLADLLRQVLSATAQA